MGKHAQQNPFTDVIFLHVFQYFNACDVPKLSMICKSAHHVASSEVLWKIIFERYKPDPLIDSEISWQNARIKIIARNLKIQQRNQVFSNIDTNETNITIKRKEGLEGIPLFLLFIASFSLCFLVPKLQFMFTKDPRYLAILSAVATIIASLVNPSLKNVNQNGVIVVIFCVIFLPLYVFARFPAHTTIGLITTYIVKIAYDKQYPPCNSYEEDLSLLARYYKLNKKMNDIITGKQVISQ